MQLKQGDVTPEMLKTIERYFAHRGERAGECGNGANATREMPNLLARRIHSFVPLFGG